MSWFLRKNIRLGPLRLNLLKRGVGGSLGVKGLHAGVDASGKPDVAGGRGCDKADLGGRPSGEAGHD